MTATVVLNRTEQSIQTERKRKRHTERDGSGQRKTSVHSIEYIDIIIGSDTYVNDSDDDDGDDFSWFQNNSQ